MTSILFGVCTHGDEQAGVVLFNEFPYGKIKLLSWKTLLMNPAAMQANQRYFDEDLNRVFDSLPGKTYEKNRAEYLVSSVFPQFDVFFDVHTTTEYQGITYPSSVFVNDLSSKTKKWLSYISASFVILDDESWNKKFTTSWFTQNGRVGITLEYPRFGNVVDTQKLIRDDFVSITEMKKSTQKKIYLKSYGGVTWKTQRKTEVALRDYIKLTNDEKYLLNLQEGEYYPIFCGSKSNNEFYCFLNKEI